MANKGQGPPPYVSVDEWKSMWDKNDTPFHVNKVYHKLLNGRENINVFVPLCGKSLDMKWLAEKGHTVIVVEASDIALVDFFKENDVKYSVKDVKEIDGKLYASEDNKIKLYCCDFFLFNDKLEGKMDVIWDRGSLIAINIEDRKRYAEVMEFLMTPSCRYLVKTVDYDNNLFTGPPHLISEAEIKEMFGGQWNVEFLERTKVLLAESLSSFSENFQAVSYADTHMTLFLLIFFKK